MKIAVRLDDITPDMDWERFLTFKKLLDKHGIKPLIGVVPDNQDDNLRGKDTVSHPEFWSYIAQLQKEGWVIAMHGYRHIYSTTRGGLFPLNDFSEFAGVSFEKQLAMLKDGRQLLKNKGIETDLFMAPAHSYDQNTLQALKETGFNALTDGFGDRPYQWQGLTFYPISFRLKKTLQKKKGYSTLVVHTGTISDSEMGKYEGYFENNQVQWISFDEYRKQEPIHRSFPGRGKEYFLASGKAGLSKLLGWLKRRS